MTMGTGPDSIVRHQVLRTRRGQRHRGKSCKNKSFHSAIALRIPLLADNSDGIRIVLSP